MAKHTKISAPKSFARKPHDDGDDLHPEGKFLGTIRAIGTSRVGAKQTPKIWVLVETDGGKCFWSGWLTPKAKPATFKALKALGWDENYETLPELVGEDVKITVQHETSDEYPTAARIRYLDPARRKVMDPTIASASNTNEDNDGDDVPF